MKNSVLIVSLLISSSRATTPAKTCIDYEIPVTIESLNFIFAKPFQSNYDVVDLLSNVASRTAATDFNPYSSTALQTASYTISATFCAPRDTTSRNGIVLLASHGLNFDRSYWDPNILPANYSFVDFAIAHGYSVFYYDRLGVGKSSLVSGYLAQASNQVAILQTLAHEVKAGNYTGDLGIPKSLILIGHSFGSSISAAAATVEPDICDGLVLTGFSYNGTNGAGFLEALQPRIAATQSPGKWRQLDSGYLTGVDLFSSINVFFKAPDYDPAVTKYANENKQPFAINEAISTVIVDTKAKSFTGVAMIITGQYDLIFCTGQCDAVIEHPATEIFSKAKAFEAVSFPGAGHGLNFASNATLAFKRITDFLGANGL